MKFSDDPKLEALIGKVCLVFARVEQEGGHVVTAADGNWDAAMSADYLSYSSNSGLLLDWLKEVARAYPEVKEDVSRLRTDLRDLKNRRGEWAHSAAAVDLWLMMKEKSLTSMTDRDVEDGVLLNGRHAGHISAPTEAEVDAFVERASEIGDAASSIARRLAELAEDGVRSVRNPRERKPIGRWARFKRMLGCRGHQR